MKLFQLYIKYIILYQIKQKTTKYEHLNKKILKYIFFQKFFNHFFK